MFRSIVVLFAALALIQVTSGYDVSKIKNVQLQFSASDGVPKTDLKALADERGPGFIGDLTIGRHFSDETVFRRTVEFNNPTNVVQRTTLNLSITNGIIHFISIQNDVGSYAVACDDPNSLGSSRSSINLRVPPNSRSSLTLIIAAH